MPIGTLRAPLGHPEPRRRLARAALEAHEARHAPRRRAAGDGTEVPLIQVRRSEERGHADHGWLDTRHTFSFADYYDAAHMGFRALRVINEDVVQPGAGFETHGHRDMEIVTYVLEGALRHADSLGTGSVIRPGEVQRMSAGTGVLHSEHNASKEERVHLYQIWLLPERKGVRPSYEQKSFDPDAGRGALVRLVSRDGGGGALSWNQDAVLYGVRLVRGTGVVHALPPGRHAWLQVARGSIALNGAALAAGDGAAASGEPRLEIEAASDAEVLLFDLA
jgi:hypothetical protein